MCTQKRKINVEHLINNDVSFINTINHLFDDTYDNYVSLKLLDENNQSFYQTINMVNT